MTEIILRCSGQTIPTHVLCYRIWTHINDPFTHPQSEVKTVYAEFFDPWDWVIIHGLYEDDVNAQLFQWALDSAFIVMIILFTLSGTLSLRINYPAPHQRFGLYAVSCKGLGRFERPFRTCWCRLRVNGRSQP
jgi:hypothetical protein